jgi:hypothetical protein
MKKEIVFTLDNSQVERYVDWINGVENTNEIFIFIPTGLGDIVKVRRDDGEELDLSDIDKW